MWCQWKLFFIALISYIIRLRSDSYSRSKDQSHPKIGKKKDKRKEERKNFNKQKEVQEAIKKLTRKKERIQKNIKKKIIPIKYILMYKKQYIYINYKIIKKEIKNGRQMKEREKERETK